MTRRMLCGIVARQTLIDEIAASETFSLTGEEQTAASVLMPS